MLGKILGLCFILLLSGCGPMYKTTYYYNEPGSQRGRDCVIKCQKMRQKCEKWAEDSYQSCKLRKSAEKIAVSALAPSNRRSPFAYDRYDGDCEYDRSRKYNSCLEDFNACFRLCGGVVDTIEECVANCD